MSTQQEVIMLCPVCGMMGNGLFLRNRFNGNGESQKTDYGEICTRCAQLISEIADQPQMREEEVFVRKYGPKAWELYLEYRGISIAGRL